MTDSEELSSEPGQPEEEPSPRGRLSRLGRRAFIEIGYLVFLVVVLELTLRAGGLALVWSRDLRTEAPQETADFRILAIGESTTFGLGVDPEESYPAVLGKLLGERTGKKVAVYNTGVPGQTSVSILRNLQQQLWKYRPDLVICLFGINDSNEALNDLSASRVFGFRVPDWIADLRVYRLVCLIRDYVLYRPKLEDHGAWVFFDPEQRRANRDWIENFDYLPDLESNYSEILSKIRTEGASPLMMSYLNTPEEVLQSFERIAEKEGVDYLDLHLEDPEGSELFQKDGFHPNAAGHLVMAERIAVEVLARNLFREKHE